MKKFLKLLLVFVLILINSEIVYALEIYESNEYSIYYNNIKNEIPYTVAKIGKGDRVFYDLEGIVSIFEFKGGKNVHIYKLGTNLEDKKIKSSISELSYNLGNNIKKTLDPINDYSNIKENDNIAITIQLNDNLIYGITNKIGTNKFIPFAIIKYDIYDKSNEISTYETILFTSVDIFSDVESYIENNKIYYPIRFVSELLGGKINLDHKINDKEEKTNILVSFDTKDLYNFNYIFSSEEDKKNKMLSTNECLGINIISEDNEIDSYYLYNVENPKLRIVQKKDLEEFLDDNLYSFKRNANTLSICNSGKSINVDDITFNVFLGMESGSFIPTNLTIENSELAIKNNETTNIDVNNNEIKNIEFKNSSNEIIEFDNPFSTKYTVYTTKNKLKSIESNVCFDITLNNSTQSKCVYMDPSKNNNVIKIGKYTFNILRNTKNSNTNINNIKYKNNNETEWKLLEKNNDNKYIVEGLYRDYQLLIEVENETSIIVSTDATITQDNKVFTIKPKSNIQTFDVVAEDGTKQEYEVKFDDFNFKETIEKIEIFQDTTKLEVIGPENNEFIVEDFNKNKSSKLTIKYMTSDGNDETIEFYPNDTNKNIGQINVKNNTYKITVKEKPQPISSTTLSSTISETKKVEPIDCSSTSVTEKGKTTSSVNVRTSGEIKNDNVISVLENNKDIEIISQKDNWYEIKYPNYDSKCGWISKDYVKIESNDQTNNSNESKTVRQQLDDTSNSIKERCLSDEFQIRWKNANVSNSGRKSSVIQYFKETITNNDITYHTIGTTNEFRIKNFTKDRGPNYQYALTLALILERGSNSGEIRYHIYAPKELYDYLTDGQSKKYTSLYANYNAHILNDVEYCVNNLVNKTKTGKKIKKSTITFDSGQIQLNYKNG